MARKCFLGFEYQYVALSAADLHGFVASFVAPALPLGSSVVSKVSDTTFYTPGQANVNANTTFIVGRDFRSSAFGHGAWASTGSNSYASSFGYASGCIAVTRASLDNPQEIWTTFDIRIQQPTANADDPSNLMRSEARFQIFRWGDLSLRIRRVFNYQAGPLSHTWQFEAFNGATSLGTITPPAYSTSQYAFVRIRARLDSGTNGRFEVTIDGQSLTATGINTVATTALVDATVLYFSGGFLGIPGSTGQTIYMGAIDNILIDDAAFPSGRPLGIRVSLGSDGTLTNWAPSGAASVVSALSGAGTARGTGTGATALLNLAAIGTTGFENELLGWQFAAINISNLDPIVTRKLRTGVDLSGTPFSGSYIETLVPPLSPSSINIGTILDTVWTKGGGANFVLADIANTKARLEVVA